MADRWESARSKGVCHQVVGRTLRAIACAGLLFGLGITAKADKISDAEAKKMKSPIAYSKKSIDLGRTQYRRACPACHGLDGKSTVDVVADATDLTAPKFYKHGIAEGEIFRSIKDGAGETMPTFAGQLTDQEIWHLVNYIRSLWPEANRPPLVEDK
jgi:copper transport protein